MRGSDTVCRALFSYVDQKRAEATTELAKVGNPPSELFG